MKTVESLCLSGVGFRTQEWWGGGLLPLVVLVSAFSSVHALFLKIKTVREQKAGTAGTKTLSMWHLTPTLSVFTKQTDRGPAGRDKERSGKVASWDQGPQTPLVQFCPTPARWCAEKKLVAEKVYLSASLQCLDLRWSPADTRPGQPPGAQWSRRGIWSLTLPLSLITLVTLSKSPHCASVFSQVLWSW